MQSLVTPAVWRPAIAVTLDGLAAATPKSLVSRAHALNFCAVVIMGDKATAVAIFDLKVALVAADTVEGGGDLKGGEELGEVSKELRRGSCEVREGIKVQGLWGDGLDKIAEGDGIGGGLRGRRRRYRGTMDTNAGRRGRLNRGRRGPELNAGGLGWFGI